jgi:hypothetical protein
VPILRIIGENHVFSAYDVDPDMVGLSWVVALCTYAMRALRSCRWFARCGMVGRLLVHVCFTRAHTH